MTLEEGSVIVSLRDPRTQFYMFDALPGSSMAVEIATTKINPTLNFNRERAGWKPQGDLKYIAPFGLEPGDEIGINVNRGQELYLCRVESIAKNVDTYIGGSLDRVIFRVTKKSVNQPTMTLPGTPFRFIAAGPARAVEPPSSRPGERPIYEMGNPKPTYIPAKGYERTAQGTIQLSTPRIAGERIDTIVIDDILDVEKVSSIVDRDGARTEIKAKVREPVPQRPPGPNEAMFRLRSQSFFIIWQPGPFRVYVEYADVTIRGGMTASAQSFSQEQREDLWNTLFSMFEGRIIGPGLIEEMANELRGRAWPVDDNQWAQQAARLGARLFPPNQRAWAMSESAYAPADLTETNQPPGEEQEEEEPSKPPPKTRRFDWG